MNNWESQSVWENTNTCRKVNKHMERGSPQGITWRKGKPEEGCKIILLRSEQREECLCLWNVNFYVYETLSPQIYTSCHGFWLPVNPFCSLRYPRLLRYKHFRYHFLSSHPSLFLVNPACFNNFIKMKTFGWRNRNYKGRYLVVLQRIVLGNMQLGLLLAFG